jgi:hypothetical protein
MLGHVVTPSFCQILHCVLLSWSPSRNEENTLSSGVIWRLLFHPSFSLHRWQNWGPKKLSKLALVLLQVRTVTRLLACSASRIRNALFIPFLWESENPWFLTKMLDELFFNVQLCKCCTWTLQEKKIYLKSNLAVVVSSFQWQLLSFYQKRLFLCSAFLFDRDDEGWVLWLTSIIPTI